MESRKEVNEAERAVGGLEIDCRSARDFLRGDQMSPELIGEGFVVSSEVLRLEERKTLLSFNSGSSR